MIKNTKILLTLLAFSFIAVFLSYLFFYHPKVIKAQDAAVHPRLLFTADEIPALKQKINDGLSFDDSAFDYIITLANNLIIYTSPSTISGQNYGIHNIPTLAIAYQLSEESNPNKYIYRDKCKQGVLYLVDTYTHEVGEDPHWPSHRLYSISLGYDMCFDSATAEEKQRVVNELETYMTVATHPYNWAWNAKKYRPYGNNGGVLAGSTLGLASIVLRGESANTTLLNNALEVSGDILALNLTSIFDEKGAYTEGALYASFAMRFFVPYIEARERYDGYDYGALPEVKNIANWMAYGVRPNQWSWINNLNDALYSTRPYNYHNTYLDWAIEKYQSGLAKWLYTKTVSICSYWSIRDLWATVLYNNNIEAVNPGTILPKSEIFPHRGLYYYRTGWPDIAQQSTGDSVFSLYSGKFWSGHAQEDQGQFTLWSKGENFVTDTGYGSPAKQSEGHNLVFIDNLGQHNAGSSCGTDGSISRYLLSDFTDYIRSDNSAAYGTYSEFNAMNYPFPGTDWSWCYAGANPVLKADRYVLTVKKAEVGEYFVIFDDIDKDGANHQYDWTLHTGYSNSYSYTGNPAEIVGGNAGNKLLIYFINPDFTNLSFSQSTFDAQNSDGITRKLKVGVNASNPEFFTLLFPKNVLGSEPSFNFNKLSVTDGYGARLDWNNNYQDYLLYNKGDSVFSEDITTNARFTLVRKNGGNLVKFSLSEGSSLTVDGLSVVTTETENVDVSSDGIKLSISDPTAVYIIYGPNVATVVDNEDNEVSFGTAGDYVYINTPAPDVVPPGTINNLSAN